MIEKTKGTGGLVTVNSISGGKTSCYMAVHFPAAVNIFALVCIDYAPVSPKDPAIRRYATEKLNGDFIATAESTKTLRCLLFKPFPVHIFPGLPEKKVAHRLPLRTIVVK